jgi:hypothetical protein
LAELVQALLLPEEECAAADARLAEGFAAEPAEPQVDDHSVPAEGSNERAPADYWAAQRVADSGLPPAYSVALQVAGWEKSLPGDYWVAPQLAGLELLLAG